MMCVTASTPADAQRPNFDVQLPEDGGTYPTGDLFIASIDTVWTAAGDPIAGASILIRDGVIRSIGTDLSPPNGVPVVDGSGLHAMPGIVDEHSHIAISASNEGSAPIVAEVRVLDADAVGPTRVAFRFDRSLDVPTLRLFGMIDGELRPVPAPPVGGDFAKQRGRLPWPVKGKILKPFGVSEHPEFKTVVMNKGINIGVPLGTPVKAVADGSVEYVNWLPGYGKCIIVNHGGGYYTLYAHASEVFPRQGEAVKAGQVIAESGDTGSLNGSQLYFEVRKGRDPVDPGQWLQPR